jgi:hypothetical protein
VAQQNYRKALGAAARSEIRSLVRHEVEGPWAEVLKVYTTDELGRVVPSKAVTAEDARAWVHTWDARDAFAYLVHA